MFSLRNLSIIGRLYLLMAIFTAGYLGFGALAYTTLSDLRVNGPLYGEVVQNKDLVADILPPPLYVRSTLLTVYQMVEEKDSEKLKQLARQFADQRTEFESRVSYWKTALPEGALRDGLFKRVVPTGQTFLHAIETQFLPALSAADRTKAKSILEFTLTPMFEAHHSAVEAVVQVSTSGVVEVEKRAATVIAERTRSLVLLACGTLALVLAIGLLLRSVLHKSLTTIVTVCKDLAEGEGNLTKRVPAEGSDELAQLGHYLNEFIGKLQHMMGQVAHVTDKVASASVELSATAQEISKGTDTLTSRASQTAAAVEEMNSTVGQVAQNSGKAAGLAQETVKTAQEGGTVVTSTISGMQQLSEAVSSSATIISDLGKSSDQIGEIVRTIEDIADQTNLLALNAAIEAARAGEQGRGFAVVADEVRKLAESTTSSAQEIGVKVSTMQSSIRTAVANMGSVVTAARDGQELSEQGERQMEEIRAHTAQATVVIEGVSAAMIDQDRAATSMSSKVETLARVSEENCAAGTLSATVSQALDEAAACLRLTVQRFKV